MNESYFFAAVRQRLSIGTSNARIELVKWILKRSCIAIAYFVGAVLTFGACTDLYHQYRDYPTFINLTIKDNVNLTLPNILICFPFHSVELLSPGNVKLGNTTHEKELNEYFNTTNGTEMFNPNSFIKYWPNTFIYIVHKYLTNVFMLEDWRGNISYQFHNWAALKNDPEWKIVVEILIPKLVKYNISTMQLAKTFEKRFPFYRWYLVYKNNRYDENYTATHITFIGERKMCFEAEINSRLFETSQIYFWALREGTNNSGSGSELDYISFDFSGKKRPSAVDLKGESVISLPWALSGTYSVFEDNPSNFVIVSVSANYLSLSLINGRTVCSVNESLEICRMKCLQAELLRVCNCTAGTFTTTTPSDRVSGSKADPIKCSFEHYETCANYYYLMNTHCADRCMDSCERKQFELKRVGREYFSHCNLKSSSAAGVGCAAAITVQLYPQAYPEFEEQPLSYVDLVGSIGGTIGLWLDLSFLIVFKAIIITPLFFVINKNSSRLESNSTLTEAHASIPRKKFISRMQKEFKICQFASTNVSLIKYFCKNIIVAALFLTGVQFTVQMYTELLISYFGSETISHFDTISSETIALPPAEFSVPAIKDKLDDYWIQEAGGNKSSYPYLDALEEYFHSINYNRAKFLSTEPGDEWPATVTYITHVYLSGMHACELLLIDFETAIYQLFSKNADKHYTVKEYFLKIIDIWNITSNELSSKYAHEIRTLYGLSAEFLKSNNSSVINFSIIYRIFSNSVNFYIPFQDYPFNKTDIGSSILFKANIFVVNELQDKFSFRFLTDNNADTNIYLIFGEEQNISITVKADYDLMAQNSKECSDRSYREEIATLCRINLLENLCNCSQTSYQFTLKNKQKQECSAQRYNSCLGFYTTRELANKCNYRYQPSSCRHKDYTFERKFIPISFEKAQLRLFVNDFTYPYFSLELKYTNSEMWSNCGGLLGFYLGLDCTHLAICFFIPLSLLLGFILKKVRNNGDNLNSQFRSEATVNRFLKKMAGLLNLEPNDSNFTNSNENIKWMIGKLFWFFFYATGGAITLYMSIELYAKFLSNPTASKLNFKSNSSFTLPESSICLPLTGEEFMEGMNSFETTKNNYLDSANASSICFKKLKGLSESTNFNLKFYENNSEWPPCMMWLVHEYLALMGELEMFGYENGEDKWNRSVNLETASLIKIIENAMKQINMTANKMKQQFGSKLLSIYTLHVTAHMFSHKDSINNTNIRPSFVTHISSTKICYNLPLNQVMFESPHDYVRISINRSSLPNPKIFVPDPNVWIPLAVADPITIDLNGNVRNDKSTSSKSDSLFSYQFGDDAETAIGIEAIFRSLPINNGTVICSQTESKETCETQCHLNTVEKICNCSFENAVMKIHYRSCYLEDYEKFFANPKNFNLSCAKTCVPNCDRVRYQRFDYLRPQDFHKNQPNGQLSPQGPNEALIKLHIKSFYYPVYEEVFVYSFKTFTAELGGTLGLFIGLSFIGIVKGLIASVLLFIKIEKGKQAKVDRLNGQWRKQARKDIIVTDRNNLRT